MSKELFYAVLRKEEIPDKKPRGHEVDHKGHRYRIESTGSYLDLEHMKELVRECDGCVLAIMTVKQQYKIDKILKK